MTDYAKPAHWGRVENKLFPYQVGFTSPPHDFDAAPSDFCRMAPETVGVHGRLLHVPVYDHALDQRADNFHLLEEVVHCMANGGADVVGQVGTNWVHAGGTDCVDIEAFCSRISETYQTPFHMAGLTLVQALRELDIERVALNSVYYRSDWRDGTAGFLRSAGIDVVWCGNFVDLGFYETESEMNAQHWVFPGAMAVESMIRTVERAPGAAAIVVNGMPNWRRPDGLPERTVHLVDELEAAVGMPIVSSDFALYWAIFETLGVSPLRTPGTLLSRLG